MKEPAWVLREVVLMAHEQSPAQFGGSAGVRDEGLLDSAPGKPQNLFAYGKPSLFELAASYAFGLVKNHPFFDGNQRAGFLVAVTFSTGHFPQGAEQNPGPGQAPPAHCGPG